MFALGMNLNWEDKPERNDSGEMNYKLLRQEPRDQAKYTPEDGRAILPIDKRSDKETLAHYIARFATSTMLQHLLKVTGQYVSGQAKMHLVHAADETELVNMLHGLAWNFNQNDEFKAGMQSVVGHLADYHADLYRGLCGIAKQHVSEKMLIPLLHYFHVAPDTTRLNAVMQGLNVRRRKMPEIIKEAEREAAERRDFATQIETAAGPFSRRAEARRVAEAQEAEAEARRVAEAKEAEEARRLAEAKEAEDARRVAEEAEKARHDAEQKQQIIINNI